MASATQSSEPTNLQNWAPGALIATAIGLLYLAVRPPLFDIDGYVYRLVMLGPDRLEYMDHAHLLWEPLQILMLAIARPLGNSTIFPFQIFGVLVNCVTLFLFWILLRKVSASSFLASTAVITVAFSPRFWYLGFQNEPYPLLFLFVVLYLMSWHTADGNPPSGLRLIAAGFCLAGAIFFHQAAVVLVPAGCLALLIFGDETPRSRIVRAILWGAGVAVVVVPVYLYVWSISGSDSAWLPWTLGEYEEQHFLELSPWATFIKSTMGASGAILQSDSIQSFLGQDLSAKQIFALYGSLGIATCAGLAALVWLTRSNRLIVQLTKTNALFMVSLLSIFFWSAVVSASEPVTSNYWVLDFFPALVCLGFIFRACAWRGLIAFAAIALVLSPVNGYLNHAEFYEQSRNPPERLIASVNQHLGKGDIFIVLASKDWYGSTDYESLFRILKQDADARGQAILNDYVLRADKSSSWSDQLGDKVRSTIDSGGKVYVGASVLDPDSYSDLAGAKDPFSPNLNLEYVGINGPALLQQVKQVFAPYNLKDSDFKIGDDEYFVLQRK
jgi:hypothetical protein